MTSEVYAAVVAALYAGLDAGSSICQGVEISLQSIPSLLVFQ